MTRHSDIDFMRAACMECDNSTCGYKTGCVVVKDGKIILRGWNERLDGEIYCGDGVCDRERLGLSGGRDIEKVCSLHAEASVVAQAAMSGKSIKNCSVYVTTFPCVICARLLAKAKVGKLFYMSDYLGGNSGMKILESVGILVTKILEKDVWTGRSTLKTD